MSKRKWQEVTDPSKFRQGWEVEHVVEVAFGVTRKTRGIFGGYDEALGVRSTHDGRIGDFRVPQSAWFQRPPKAMKEPTALHSMVQVDGRQFIQCETSEVAVGNERWLEISDYRNHGTPQRLWLNWKNILNLGTPTPYTPEATNE